MQPLNGNTTTNGSHRRYQVGPSRTRLVNRHNPYATTVPQHDTDGSTLKGQRRNRKDGRPRPSAKRHSAAAIPNGTWEGASQGTPYLQLPESTPLSPPTPTSAITVAQPDDARACASTTVLPPPPPTPRLVGQAQPLDEFGLYTFLDYEYEDDYGSNFFDSFNLSASHAEQSVTPSREAGEVLRTTSRAPTPLPEPARRSAGRINLSSLHHRVMRSKGYVPDIALDRLDGVVRKQVLRKADRLMFEYQAQSREQRKWRGYRESEDDGLSMRPKKKVRFNPCPTEGRNRRRRSTNCGVDELAHQVNRIRLTV